MSKNPLIDMLGRQDAGSVPGMQLLEQLQDFKDQGWTEQSAEAKVNELLQSGQINGRMVEKAKQMARSMGWLLNGLK